MADSRKEREKVLADYRTRANEKKEFAEKVERRVSRVDTRNKRGIKVILYIITAKTYIHASLCHSWKWLVICVSCLSVLFLCTHT